MLRKSLCRFASVRCMKANMTRLEYSAASPNHLHRLQDVVVFERTLPSLRQRFYSTQATKEDEMESSLRKKVGWLLKLLAAGTLTYVGINMFPLMGDSMIWQTVALVRSDDPFMQRSGASRICWIAKDDKRRRNFVEAGGVLELSKMLRTAPDDKTRRGAVKALVTLCQCDVAVEALHALGTEPLVQSLASESSDPDIASHSTALLEKLGKYKESAANCSSRDD